MCLHREYKRCAYRVLVEKPEGKIPLGRLIVDESIILKWMCKNLDGQAWTGLIWIGIGRGGAL
jgi:hypothetical protein